LLGGTACRIAECGDGFRSGSEECDDKNLAFGDGCGSTCRIEVTNVYFLLNDDIIDRWVGDAVGEELDLVIPVQPRAVMELE
jgi:cysteine-rich repeat protein